MGKDVVRAFQFTVEDTSGFTTTDWVYTNKLNQHFSNSFPYPDSLLKKKSTSFSGEMRKVVQLLAGQNAPIAYDYGWPRTHGIFVNSQDASRWVIEISSSGVTAWPLRVCTGESLVPASALPYTPAPVRELPDTVDRRVLADASAMTDIYIGSSLSQEIGWAFSYSGGEAQIVVIRGGYVVGAHTYSKTFRYKVAIGADSDGAPEIATVTEEASDWAYSNIIQSQVRVPIFKTCGLASHRYDFIIGPGVPPPTEEDYQFPIFVYYAGDAEQAFDYYYAQPVVDSIPNVWPYTCLTGSYQLQNNSSYTYNPALQGIQFIRNGDQTKSGAIIVGVPGANTTKYNNLSITAEWLGTQEIESITNGPAGVIYQGKIELVFGKYWIIKKRGWYDASSSQNYHFAFVIPFFEREGYFFQERFAEGIEGGTEYWESRSSFYSDWRDSDWWPLSTLVKNTDGNPCIPANAWSQQIATTCEASWSVTPIDCTDGPSNNGATFELPYSPGVSNVTLLSGPTVASCCPESTTTRVYYEEAGGSVEKVSRGQDYSHTYEPPTYETTDITNLAFHYADDAGAQSVGTEYADNILFSGDLDYDPANCGASTPIWLGAWMDAFQTGNGFISPEPLASVTEPQIVGSIGSYDAALLPADASTAGWLGLPFPEEFD